MAAVIAFAFLFGGCRGKNNGTEPTAEPVVTEAPQVDQTFSHLICYWPEDADYSTCDYALVVEKPEFSETFTAGHAMNLAVEKYLDELSARIENEYLPASIAKPPYTEVACRVENTGSITNIIFTERHCYEAQPYTETYVLMLNERGSELNLCDVLLTYHAEALIAEHIAGVIAGDTKYFSADAAKVLSCLDIRHGACASNDGCTVYIREGMLAPYEEGELSFDIRFADVCPDFVGSGKAVSEDEYRLLVEFLGMVCDAAIVRGDDITGGALSPYAATAFMREAAAKMGIVSKAGRINVPAADFEDYYRRCFGNDFPGIDTDAHDIKLQDGNYSVLARLPEYSYYLDITGGETNGDMLELRGDVTFGTFGYAFSDPVCHASVTLVRSADSPFGFVLREFRMSL